MVKENKASKVSGSDNEGSSEKSSQLKDPFGTEMILESISDAFFTLDGKLKFIYFNNKAEELLGRKREEVLGKHIFEEAFPEAKGSIFQEKYLQALKQNEKISFETYFGKVPYANWYDVRVYPTGNGISVFFNVTTERKKMELEKEKNQAFLNAIFESSLNAIVVADDMGNYTKVNKAASEMFGYSMEELQKMNVSEIVTADGSDTAERYAKYLERGYEIGEFHFKRKDGERRISQYHAVRIAEDMNLSILSDVTEKKVMEKEMQKRVFDLGERVKELNCLMEISKIVETKGITIEEIVQRSVETIPPSWQHPGITCARIVYERKEFKTENFKKTDIKLREPLYIDSDESGWIEVYLLVRPESKDKDPFLKEEKDLLFMIAERLGKVLQRVRAERKLNEINKELNTTNQQLAAHEQQLLASNQQMKAMNQQLRSSEQQLQASNQELLALNQQLQASEQQLKAMNQELIQSEASLKESNERFDLAMDASRDGLFDWNLVTNEIYYSPGWKKMLGYEDNELPNDFSVWEKLTDPEDVKRSWEMQKELISGKRDRFEMEFQMKHKDGHYVDIFSRAEAVFNEKGEAVRIVGTHVDVTDKKELLDIIIKSESRIRNIIDNSTNMYYAHGTDHILTYVSPQCREILGYEPEEVMRKWTDLASDHPSNEIAFDHTIKAIETGERQPTYELQLIRKDGKKIWVEVRESPKVVDGKVTEIIGSLNDITERKKSEEEILKKQYLLSKSQEIGKIGTWEFDLIHNEIVWTDETYRIFGVPIGEPQTYESFLDRLHPDDIEIVDKVWKEGIEKGEYEIKHRVLVDGEVKWVLEKAEFKYSKDGEPIGAIGFTQDISKHKSAEDQIKRAKDEVEFYMDLLGHDLGNIHQGVSGSLQLLQKKAGSDPRTNAIIDLANESVSNATALTREVILLSKLRHQEMEMETMDLKKILQISMDQINANFIEKDIDFEMDLKERSILGEPIIKELVINILHNAVRLQGAKPWIDMRSMRKNGMVRIEISDKGPGVPDSQKDMIFQRFGLKGERIRRGLGLSIVKVLSERYGGKVWVEDRVKGDHKKGAKFIVELPLAE